MPVAAHNSGGYNAAMDDLAEQLARRDRLRRALALQKTPEQRMEEMDILQKSMWETLMRSPEGYAHFLRRNFKARAIDVKDPNG
jgi:hypothetical protein